MDFESEGSVLAGTISSRCLGMEVAVELESADDPLRVAELLRRAEAPADHVLMRSLERFQAVPRSDLGRNDVCWCGSGRKYKKCHLNSEQLPLAERADWLYEKAGLFLMDYRWDTVRDFLADLHAGLQEDHRA